MTQAAVDASREMSTKAESKKIRIKRPSSLVKPEAKKRKVKEEEVGAESTTATEKPLKKKPEVPSTLYGSCNNMVIQYNTTYVTLQKNRSKFRLYGRQLTALQDELLQLSTAVQDQAPFELTLPGEVKVMLKQYERSGMYVELSQSFKDGKNWTLSLKTCEFVYFLESINDLLEKLGKDECRPSEAISTTSLYEEAVLVYADLVGDEIRTLQAKQTCHGCIIDHPSQNQHSCLTQNDADTIETMYLDEAVAAVPLEKFTQALQKKTENKRAIVSTKLLWNLCKTGTMLQRVKETAMIPHLLNREIATLTKV